MAYTREQWEQRIDEAGAGRHEFVRWSVDGEFGATKKCVVRCKVDNFVWSARANDLVSGVHGCPHCSGKRIWTSDARIEQINKLDGIKFVCWVDSYENSHSKANLRCLIDGYEWSASVSSIVHAGSGCHKCAGNRRWTSEERIEQINALNNIEFVSWSDVYKGKGSKANIRCKLDGFEWAATVNNLINSGTGCPKCANGGYDQSKTGYLYALRSECGKYVKVGISNNPSQRHKKLEKSTPFSFSCIEQISGDGSKIAELEKYFHGKYERAGFTGFDGCTEWLVCNSELLSELRGLSIEHE